MHGADVAHLRQLAGQFQQAAERLESNRMTVGNAIQISAWVGPVAMRFRHEWDSDYSRRIQSAAHRLRDAAQSLRANADDQERTSAVSGSVGGGVSSRSIPTMAGQGQQVSVFPWLQGMLEWSPYKDEKLIRGFDAGFFLSKVPGLGSAVTAIGLGDILADPSATNSDRAWAVGDAAVSSAVGAISIAGPVGYLSGAAVSQVWDVIDLAAHTDWGPEQAATNWEFIASNPGEAAVAAAEAVVQYIPDLIDNLWPF